MKRVITVSHYHQNPRQNTTEEFDNLKDAREALMGISDDSDTPGVSILEIKNGSWRGKTSARRDWNKTRAEWS